MTAATTLHPSDKREAILDAALVLFAERGFYGTAVPAVAEQAHVGLGTIYRYFPSKEALVNALYQREKATFSEAVLTGFPFAAPFREQLHHFWSRSCAYARQHPVALQFLELHHHAPYLDEVSQKIEQQLLASATTIVDQAVEKQIVKDLPPALLMAVVWGSFRALVQGGCEGHLVLDATTADQVEGCVWEAIRR
jgi:TetR/AcrR family transcriptional regulator, repressor of fatR-cypB operon